MSINQDEVIQIIKLLDESSYDELNLQMGDLKLVVKKSGSGGPIPHLESDVVAPAPLVQAREESAVEKKAPAPVEPAEPPAETQQSAGSGQASIEADGLVPIKAPLLGTFYRSPKPDAPPFVEVGSRVTENDTVCMIEVMKTYTTITAGVIGRVVRICAENTEMVEHQQILFLIEPE